MDLKDIVRLIRNNLVILIGTPIIAALLTIYFTKDIPKKYVSTTMVYTGLATGFNIENTNEVRKDQFVVNNSFENLLNTIKSRETLREVSFKLLSQCLVNNGEKLNSRTLKDMNEWLYDPQLQKLVVFNNAEETFKKLTLAYETQSSSRLVHLFNESKTAFGLKKLSEIKATRKGRSDMIEISYEFDDQYISNQTLQYALNVFMRRYKGIKQSETGNVVNYFKEQLNKARSDLNQAENRMKTFRENGQILNYYEQTKALAGKKEDITDERARLAGELDAADQTLRKLEQKLDINREAFFKNDQLIQKKEKVSLLAAEIARNTLSNELDEIKPKTQKLKTYETELSEGVRKLYARNHSTESIAIKTLLDAWLENMILIEKNKSRLKTLNNRLGNISKDYHRFAPLGSGLSRLEREINVNEKAYIQILHDLNLALLRKQNIELSSNLEVIDKPITLQNPTKRLILVVLSGLITGVLLISILLVNELLDTTLKTPEKAAHKTGLPIAGVFPVQSAQNGQIFSTLTAQFNTFWKQELLHTSNTKIVLLASTRQGEGKSFIGSKIHGNLYSQGANVLRIKPGKVSSTHFSNDIIEYPETKSLGEVRDIKDIIGSWIDLSAYDYCLIEIPALIYGNTPIHLLNVVDVVILNISARRSWTELDEKALQVIKKCKTPIHTALNGVFDYSIDAQLRNSINKPEKAIKTNSKPKLLALKVA